ncbi:LruC domain-containing protein [Vibrio chagasii]|uniref:LruC domain-containing protein n=1 Tax=Vibrio TaxID=662 RepID=UPI0014934221|nr:MULTISPECIES: LruC domain-containing protein [Vibrio]MDE9381536.1 LruC domain-containing protein [Vibrio alginolyticus]MCG9605935.1 LruC domain-containing protein [Vibrio chagasii]NOI86231.1 LruC domain-containing protein [Vibrio sp. 99K-1]CAH6798394.1 LruC domain-containing protein [Vibrio chagasii]CAH6836430.1 LruC domain-containing protein [Vibrio chagasii]
MRITTLSLLLSAPLVANAAPFDTCPSKAYLFQSTPVEVWGVNLVTGSTTLLEDDTGMNANINGVGFDFEDRYIYGYDTTNKRLVRLGKDFQAEVINTSGLPTDHTFYVGDVYDHVYYLYRTGKGLFTVDLSPLDSDPNATVTVNKIAGSPATVKLTDFAFHPSDGSLYGIDNNSGGLYSFNPTTGAETYIGDTGETGTFGAGYFDVNGYYYVSRNQDGKIYRINLSPDNAANIAAGIVPADEFVPNGPISGQNDGARCANAPVVDEDSNIDFGDAPDSYLTLLASNGPRHELDGITWLGTTPPDADLDGYVTPQSDETVGVDDEWANGGIGFVTALEAGLDSKVIIEASTTGYLSAWIDWNQDGSFDGANEQVFTDYLLAAGENDLFLNVDINALTGTTWARFRFSQQTNLSYFGGSTSGEVVDIQVDVLNDGATARYFPSASGYATLAYEDNWPYKADYDMNDAVIMYRITEILKDGKVVKSTIDGRLAAVGATYKNGFAIRLPNLAPSSVDTVNSYMKHNGVFTDLGMEDGRSEAIFIAAEDLSEKANTSCAFYRTSNACKEDEQFAFQIGINLSGDGVSTASWTDMPYDPFIFATPGYYHGDNLPMHPGRSWEVHLPDQAPTEAFDTVNLFDSGIGVDDSDPATGKYFKTAENHPWALIITSTEEWEWPQEYVDIVTAYPEFKQWAESGGDNNQTWYTSPADNQCYEP